MNIIEAPTALTVDERSELEKNEKTIAKGLQTFYDVGHALADIRDRKLYRAEYETFDNYCTKRWGFSDRRARQLIAAADITENIGTIVPVSELKEGQVRELASVPPNEQRLVYQLAHELTEGNVTASAVRSLAAIANGVIASGYVEVDDGIQKKWTDLEPEQKRAVLQANLEKETWERMQRHKARKSISESMNDPIIEKLTIPKQQVHDLRKLAGLARQVDPDLVAVYEMTHRDTLP